MDIKTDFKGFLESIPKFLREIEPKPDYLKPQGFPEYIWKNLDRYEIIENETGFEVSGRVAVMLYDLVFIPGWAMYKANHPDMLDDPLYEMYLQENPGACSKFVLEEFCDTFKDFYNEFLTEHGWTEADIDIKGNSVMFNGNPVSSVVPKASDASSDEMSELSEEDSEEETVTAEQEEDSSEDASDKLVEDSDEAKDDKLEEDGEAS